MMKKILLAAINAKYIHSNLAVYSLKAYADERLADVCAEGAFAGVEIEIGEYTINQQPEVSWRIFTGESRTFSAFPAISGTYR